MKRVYVFGAGVALGVAATRRTRRAKEAAAAAMKAKLTPSAIAADLADAIAELGNAVGAFASDVRQGAINRRASYRSLVDNSTGAVVMVPPEALGPAPEPVEPRIPGGLPPTRPTPTRAHTVDPDPAGSSRSAARRLGHRP
jgi:hypothetical protein